MTENEQRQSDIAVLTGDATTVDRASPSGLTASEEGTLLYGVTLGLWAFVGQPRQMAWESLKQSGLVYVATGQRMALTVEGKRVMRDVLASYRVTHPHHRNIVERELRACS